MTYDIQCEECGRVKEIITVQSQRFGEHWEPCVCGSSMKIVPALANEHVTGFKPFWHPHLGHTPVYVESWKHYRQLLAERNKSNVLAN